MPLKAIAFDWCHTLMDERRDEHIPLDASPVRLMPGVADVVPQLMLPLAVWANTRAARETTVRGWLDRAGLSPLFRWVITSVDAGARKPAPEFFQYALARCGLTKDEVLFVGNQLNSDIAGGEAFGIRTVWLCGSAHLSPDDGPSRARATFTMDTPASTCSKTSGFVGRTTFTTPRAAHVHVLAASIRSVNHLLCSFVLGSALATVPPKVLEEWAAAGFPTPGQDFSYRGSMRAVLP